MDMNFLIPALMTVVGLTTPIGKSYHYEPEADIDEIKNLKRLKDLISRKRLTRKLQVRGQHAGPAAAKSHLEELDQ